jgi:bifunctional non-homologous end joining protein LigD
MTPAGPPVLPMMASLGELPTGAGWSYEMKWDGIRVIAEVDEGVCRLWF